MIIDDLNVEGIPFFPSETYSLLVIDADAVLPGAVAFQRLQAVAGRYPQILQAASAMEI